MSERFSTLQDSAQPTDPAEANGCWEWIEQMEKLGFTVIGVEIQYVPEVLQQLGAPEVLAAQLISEELGHFDSHCPGPGDRAFTLFFYVHAKTLSQAVKFIKARLEQFGLLNLSKMRHADSGDRVWYRIFPALES